MKHTNTNIAVVVSSIDEEYQNKILRGIHSAAETHNVNICHYIAYGGMLSNRKHDTGEFNIYNLINYEYLDGVILLTNTVASSEMKETIINSVSKSGIPAVSVDHDLPDFYYIGIDNYKAMYTIIEHAVKTHTVRNPFYISGPDNNPESIQRLQAFRQVMLDYNIPIDESKQVFHGMFTASDGRAAAEWLLLRGEPLPDAIFCANDVMALSALLALEGKGVRVPQDMIITGFDNISAARNYSPELTTVSRPLFETGQIAVEMILNDLAGTPQERRRLLEATPVFTQSCGCTNSFGDSIETFKKKNYLKLERFSMDVQRNNKMSCCMTECDSLEESIEQLRTFVKELRCEAFYLCLCNNWQGTLLQDNSATAFAFDDFIIEGYTDKMQVALAYRDGAFVHVDDFNSELMIPDLHHPNDTGNIYFFSPLHFRERCLGYCVFKNSDFPMTSANFASWLMNISNSLENIRKINCMNAVVKELDRLYIIDPLSGIYNRNGFARSTQEIYQYCAERQLPVMIMFLDMDGLKIINDTYGHKSGDAAIHAVAQAIKKACDNGEVYARFGGDEFLVFAVDYNDDRAQLLTMKIRDAFREYNETTTLSFHIDASIGYHITVPDARTPLFHLVTVADQKMYDEKKKKKTSRYLRKC